MSWKFNGRRPIPASVMPLQGKREPTDDFGAARALRPAHLNTSASFKLARSCLRQTRHLPAVFFIVFFEKFYRVDKTRTHAEGGWRLERRPLTLQSRALLWQQSSSGAKQGQVRFFAFARQGTSREQARWWRPSTGLRRGLLHPLAGCRRNSNAERQLRLPPLRTRLHRVLQITRKVV